MEMILDAESASEAGKSQDHLHLPPLEFSETLSHYRITYSTEFSEMYPVYSVWVSKLFLSTLLF